MGGIISSDRGSTVTAKLIVLAHSEDQLEERWRGEQPEDLAGEDTHLVPERDAAFPLTSLVWGW